MTATRIHPWASCVAHEARLMRSASKRPGAGRTLSGPPSRRISETHAPHKQSNATSGLHRTQMTRNMVLSALACIAFLIAPMSIPALGQANRFLAEANPPADSPAPSGPAYGAVRGVTLLTNGAPLEAAKVCIHSADGRIGLDAMSGPDGTFSIGGLAPGPYAITAAKDGFGTSAAKTVEVAMNQVADASVELVAVSPGGAAVASNRSFIRRFIQAYADDWKGTSGGADAQSRGYPAPVTNPPFPFAVWPMGGTPWIGYPNSTSYPLTTALLTGKHGDWWKKANVQVYGWLDAGANLSTSHDGPYANAPAAYNQVANTVTLDQATLYIERVPDTVQTDHFDWGFRLTNLYGFDYRFTTAEGYFSQQLLNNPKPNGTIGNEYGYDPVMAYVDLYFPKVAGGMDLRIGRYISLPDIEAQLAPNNYTYTHSLTYTYDCYTQTGINATIKLSNRWTVQAGLSGGCEAAPWAPDAKLTGNACLAYSWTEGRNELYVCANSINDSKYSYNNLAAYYATWYHKFGTSDWHMDWETWYQYQKDTPNVNNPGAASLLLTNANGAVCNRPDELTCFAPEWASVHYLVRQLGNKNFISLRNEVFDDLKGQRTGFQTLYTEHDLSWNHWIGNTVLFRPELRYDHAYNAPAYDSGLRKSQFMVAGDMIWFF